MMMATCLGMPKPPIWMLDATALDIFIAPHPWCLTR
jgi:hypothetical protein